MFSMYTTILSVSPLDPTFSGYRWKLRTVSCIAQRLKERPRLATSIQCSQSAHIASSIQNSTGYKDFINRLEKIGIFNVYHISSLSFCTTPLTTDTLVRTKGAPTLYRQALRVPALLNNHYALQTGAAIEFGVAQQTPATSGSDQQVAWLRREAGIM